MGFRSGSVIDPSISPERGITTACDLVEADSSAQLKIRHRDQRSLILERKKLGVFILGLFFASIVPGAGFLFGYWLIHKNSRWQLRIWFEPWGTGSSVNWSLRSPIEQGELDARFAGVHERDQLMLAVALAAQA